MKKIGVIVFALFLGAAFLAPGVTRAATVGAGWNHSLAVQNSGVIWAWGNNSRGQLGDGTFTGSLIPVELTGLSDVIAVAAGSGFTLALTGDGVVWGWGTNVHGQLGEEPSEGRPIPLPISGLPPVVAIAAGGGHGLALTAEGHVWSWGRTGARYLAERTRKIRWWEPAPVDLPIIRLIAAGGAHSLVLADDGTVWAWGANYRGQIGIGSRRYTPIPVEVPELEGIVHLSAGREHSLAVDEDGVVFAWGRSFGGGQGFFPPPSQLVPKSVAGLPPTKFVAAGAMHSLALAVDGSVWAWGENARGQLGDGTRTRREEPAPVDSLSDVVFVSAGAYHNLALQSGGALWAWGANGNGQLGDGSRRARRTPVRVSLSDLDWLAATPTFTPGEGVYFTPGDITLESTTPGARIHYTIDGTDPTEEDPALVSGGSVSLDRSTTLKARAWAPDLAPSNVASAFYEFKVAGPGVEPPGGIYTEPQTITLTSGTPEAEIHYTLDGTEPTLASPVYGAAFLVDTFTVVKARGFRDGWTDSDVTTAAFTLNFGVLAAPVIEPPGGTYYSSVSVTLGAEAGAAIRYTLDGSEPDLDSELYSAPIALEHSAVLKAAAFRVDWTTSPAATAAFDIQVETPSFTPPGGAYADPQDVAIVSATPGATVRYTIDGTEPDAESTELPSGQTVTVDQSLTLKARAFKPGLTPSDIATAEYVINVPAVAAVAAGRFHSIVLEPDGTVWTWGGNGAGQLGDGTHDTRVLPDLVAGLDEVKAIAAGDEHSLAVTRAGGVWAWGENGDGQLGDGSDEPRTLPVLVSDLVDVVSVAAGSSHSLALKGDGTVWGWGANDAAQLGDDSDSAPRVTPVAVDGLPNVKAIAAGGDLSMALDNDGNAWVWGGGNPYPDAVLGQVETIAAGDRHIVAVRWDHTVWAWGENESGQLGDGTEESRWYPDQVFSGSCGGGGGGEGAWAVAAEEGECTPLEGATAPAGGEAHSLAVLANGEVWAWGDNSFGQLGSGTVDPSLTAMLVNGTSDIVQIAAGAFHNLAITADGEVWAWGRNSEGQIGDGTTENRYVPVPIADAGYAWRLATPVLSPPGGIFYATPSINVSCATPGAAIYYTLDGGEPTEESAPWPGTMLLSGSAVLKAKAFLEDRTSNTATAVYTLAVEDPVITPPGGDFDAPVSATITVTSPSATIHYTVDGTEPTETDPVIASGDAILVEYDMTLRVRAFRDGWVPGSASADFRIRVLRPEFDPPAGVYDDELDVAITTPTVGATLYYTTDGSNPSTADPILEPGETVHVDRSLVLKARAFRSDLPASDVASASYDLVVRPPVFNPPAGGYDEPQWVWVESPTPGAVVRYTLDGSYPREDSPIANAPILIDTFGTLTARAFRAGWGASDLSSAEYDIGAGRVAAPVFSPPPGSFATARQVTIDCPTDGSVVRYTTNGMGPTETDVELACGDSVYLEATTMLKARAWKDGLQQSVVRSGYYAVTGAVAAGGEFTLLLKADGTVWSWGRNNVGQLGDGTTEQRMEPVAVEGLSDVVAISAGNRHALALDAGGAVWAWGDNASGQLGTGSAGGWTTVPVRVSGLSSVTAISAGSAHNLALTTNGWVWGWGDNSSKQVGLTSDPQPSPVTVETYNLGLTGSVAAGSFHSMAIHRNTHTLKSWGNNGFGQLGFDSGGSPYGSPRLVPLGDVGMVAGGWQHTVAIRDSGAGVGEVWIWGGGTYAPKEVSGLDRAVALSAGREHQMVLDDLGQLRAWGDNGFGQLGLGYSGGGSSAPLPVAGGEDVVQSSAGAYHSAAIKADGTVWTWGYNFYGQLGDGTLDTRPTPQPIDGLLAASNSWLSEDPDGDGLTSGREQILGCNPFIADTNEDGIGDGLAIDLGLSCSHPDMDGDGLFNAEELQLGTSPFMADTDGDGTSDALDCYPLDPSRFECEPPDPGDVEPPTITLIFPPGAVLVSSNP